MNLFRQIGAVTAMNFKSLPHRVGTSIVIVIGIAGVVAVLVSVLAMSTGMIETMENSGRDDRAIVLRNGSASENGSALGRDAARLDRGRRRRQARQRRQADRIGGIAAPGESASAKKTARKSTSRMRGVGPQLARAAPGGEDHRRAACSSPP